MGSGQEIHDGEGGLAEWGAALRARPAWRVLAAPDALAAEDARRLLGPLPGLRAEALLHLDVPVRQVRSTAAAGWVDAVLRGAVTRRRGSPRHPAVCRSGSPRDLAELRGALRGLARGSRRAGLLASSGARRLRAEGLGAELPHMDEAAVAHWFLDRFPADVRASDALEQVATEFSCQGLELDHVGLCWDADLVRSADGRAWVGRNFVGTKWQIMRREEAIANQMNTYRVLLTRARYETVIFVPRGDAADATRDPQVYDAVAGFLAACGARAWDSCRLAMWCVSGCCCEEQAKQKDKAGWTVPVPPDPPSFFEVRFKYRWGVWGEWLHSPHLFSWLCLPVLFHGGSGPRLQAHDLEFELADAAPGGGPCPARRCAAAAAADFARLRGFADALDADVVAFEEVDGAEAAARVFDPARYRVVTIDEDVVQRVGLAVRRGIGVERHADVAALDVEPYAEHQLRDGLDATLDFRAGRGCGCWWCI